MVDMETMSGRMRADVRHVFHETGRLWPVADAHGAVVLFSSRNAAVRLPKRGFYNKFGKDYVEINVSVLNRFEDGTVVEPVMLIEEGVVKNIRDGIRILGNGELTKKLTVQAMGFSKSAEEKIVAAGGKIEVI